MPNCSFTFNKKNYDIEGYSEKDDIFVRMSENHTFYEISLLSKIRRLYITGTYIDIGANIGNHSIFFINECVSSNVIAIEANGDLINILKKNISNNNFCNKEYVILNALISTKEKVYFHKANEDNIGMSHSSLNKINESDELQNGSLLDSITLSLQNSSKIGLIKIDVEGQELDVIKSGQNTIAKHHPFLCLEIFPNNYQEVQSYLKRKNYLLISKFPGNNYLFGYRFSIKYNFIKVYNLLAIKFSKLRTRI